MKRRKKRYALPLCLGGLAVAGSLLSVAALYLGWIGEQAYFGISLLCVALAAFEGGIIWERT